MPSRNEKYCSGRLCNKGTSITPNKRIVKATLPLNRTPTFEPKEQTSREKVFMLPPTTKNNLFCSGNECFNSTIDKITSSLRRNSYPTASIDSFMAEDQPNKNEINAEIDIRGLLDFLGEQIVPEAQINYATYVTKKEKEEKNNIMKYVARIEIPRDGEHTKEITELCRKTALLYNHVNWLIRMRYFFSLKPDDPNSKKSYANAFKQLKQKIKDLESVEEFLRPELEQFEKEKRMASTGKQGYTQLRPQLKRREGEPKSKQSSRQTAFYMEFLNMVKYFRFYKLLPAQTAQHVIRYYLVPAWVIYFENLNKWYLDKSSMPGGRRPRPPGYQPKKCGEFVAIFTNQQVKVVNSRLQFPEMFLKAPIFISQDQKTVWDKYEKQGYESLTEDELYIFDTIEYEFRGKVVKGGKNHLHYFEYVSKIRNIRVKPEWENFTEVRIVPRQSHYFLEIVYYKQKQETSRLDKDNALSIDIGINNLLTTVNTVGLTPMVIKGKVIKSINSFANKQLERIDRARDGPLKFGEMQSMHEARILKKRHDRIQDFMHKSSSRLIKYCVEHNIGYVVYGHNKGWKNEVKVSRRFRKKFVPIPFNDLIWMIKYKAEAVGIECVETEESYTSRTCCYCGNVNEKSARRGDKLKCRSCGRTIHADINGAVNILRKVRLKAFSKENLDSLFANSPKNNTRTIVQFKKKVKIRLPSSVKKQKMAISEVSRTHSSKKERHSFPPPKQLKMSCLINDSLPSGQV